MRNRLISYVDLLFAGNPEAEDVKQEILQNTLDRFDDLVAQGKSPEAAYSLAISGIGDVSELLSGGSSAGQTEHPAPQKPEESEKNKKNKKLLQAVAVGLYILCPVPLFIFQDEIGLCLLLVLAAVATVIIIFAGGNGKNSEKEEQEELSPKAKLRKSIHSAISTVGLVFYFILSFLTGAWHLTWLVFPLIGAINGLVTAIMDLKEAE